MDVLFHPRLPPLVRPLPPLENISLFRAEESELERELRTTLGLAAPEDPQPTASSQLPPQALSEVPENPTRAVETASFALAPTPPILDSSNPPAQSSNDMQVEQTGVPPVIAPPHDQTPVKGAPPALNQTPPMVEFNEKPPVSEPPQAPPWNPISFVDDEDEEEEIPSINVDSDSD